MSWTMSACTVTQFPKEDPELVHLSQDHRAWVEFEAGGFAHGMLHGSVIAAALQQAAGRAYEDLLPPHVPQFLADANWSAVEFASHGDLARRFLELCVAHHLGVSMG